MPSWRGQGSLYVPESVFTQSAHGRIPSCSSVRHKSDTFAQHFHSASRGVQRPKQACLIVGSYKLNTSMSSSEVMQTVSRVGTASWESASVVVGAVTGIPGIAISRQDQLSASCNMLLVATVREMFHIVNYHVK
jgi:hypothetical protein